MSLTRNTINKVLSPAESNADLDHLERWRREQRQVYDLQELTNARLEEPSLTRAQRIQLRQAADNAYWDWQWGTAQRLVRRFWR